VNHPSLSTNGKRIAAIIAVVVVLALPKRVECTYPGSLACTHPGRWGHTCSDYEIEPFGFYLIELLVQRDVGFAYETSEDCH
jgi:hypothetical protein